MSVFLRKRPVLLAGAAVSAGFAAWYAHHAWLRVAVPGPVGELQAALAWGSAGVLGGAAFAAVLWTDEILNSRLGVGFLALMFLLNAGAAAFAAASAQPAHWGVAAAHVGAGLFWGLTLLLIFRPEDERPLDTEEVALR